MTFEQMLTIHLKKQVNRFRSILTGSSQPGPTGSLAIWFSSSQILTAAQGRSPWYLSLIHICYDQKVQIRRSF